MSWTRREQDKAIKKLWRCVLCVLEDCWGGLYRQSWTLPSFRVQQKRIKRKGQPVLPLTSEQWIHSFRDCSQICA